MGGVTEEIRRRVNILDVVSLHVTLRRSGRSYKGLCPFHSEKTPSFHVDPERGFFYCFGCHAGGDVFDFVMRIGSVSFREAVRELAERAGVALERSPEDERSAGERERLLRAVAEAEAFFRAQLQGELGREARRYLEGRGVDPAVRDAFQLGYAPPGWDHLLRALRGRGFDAAVLQEAGLVVQRPGGDGHYDVFRNRLVFPIRDLQGRPVAFGGRALDDATPKYLNTRETPLFAKGKTLYALDAARAAIRETGQAVIVEGYMDALACHQFGVRNAVASLGTTLTEDQVRLVKRFASRAVVVYDADAAGLDAAARALALCEEGELPVRVAVLPERTDPDSYLRTAGPEAFREVLEKARPAFEYRLELALSRHDRRTVEGKVGIVDELAPLITTAPNPVRQAEYVRIVGETLGVREEAIRAQLRRVGRGVGGGRTSDPRPVAEGDARAAAERLLLHLWVADAAVRRELRAAVDPGMFREEAHRALADALMASGAPEGDPGQVRERLRDETAVSLLGRFLIAEPPVKGNPVRVAEGCVRTIRLCEAEERIGALLQAHADAVRQRDYARQEALAAALLEARREKERIRELKVSV
jgi:DNA primase